MKSTRILNGYVVVYAPEHPSAMKSDNWNGYVYEHILIAEEKIGRKLNPNEVVHHLDLVRGNNQPKNLLVLDRDQHSVIHAWISSGAPMSKDIGVNGVNSVKAKLEETPRCSNPECRKPISSDAKYCSVSCGAIGRQVVERPDKETLERELVSNSWVTLATFYGVSDTAVRKWARNYGLIS